MPELQKALNPSVPLPDKPAFEYLQCPNPHMFGYLQNQRTMKKIPLSCHSLNCPVCGPREKARIQRAANKFFAKYKYTRMWTLTLSNFDCVNIMTHYYVLKEAWRRFITEIRRNRYLRKDQREFKFFKCLDYHKSGYIHLHVMVTCWIDQKFLQTIWERILMEILHYERHSGSVHVKAVPNARMAANYVSKYIVKATTNIEEHVRKWSKSVRTCFFEKKKSSGEWKYMFGVYCDTDYVKEMQALCLSLLVPKAITSHSYKEISSINLEIFSTDGT
jgi:hypothetical protein